MERLTDRFPVLEGRNVIVFDGVCVLCSAFFRFVLRHDRAARFHFATAQSDLGEALYAHLGLKRGDYETNLVLIDGELHEELDAFAEVMRRLGWPWRAGAAAAWLPGPLKRFLYRRIARNRYAMFGRRAECYLPTPDLRARFVD
jgi:predicted DCC family thiol-disulfide oxidoreductase YuxK